MNILNQGWFCFYMILLEETVVVWLILFTVGGLALAVEGPSKAEIKCTDNKDGTCSVSYLPTAPGEYNIIIRFADQHIAGSPFTAKITSPGNSMGVKCENMAGQSKCHHLAVIKFRPKIRFEIMLGHVTLLIQKASSSSWFIGI